MGIRSREDYKESLRRQSSKVYMEGEEVKKHYRSHPFSGGSGLFL